MLILDPYYRTITGFMVRSALASPWQSAHVFARVQPVILSACLASVAHAAQVLIEKEWLCFGHKFHQVSRRE
jgi:hypothetical protein